MTSFSAALRDALLVPDASASSDAVHGVVINQLRELDPQAKIRTTGYFNHSWVPDLSLRWGKQNDLERHVFLRFDVRDPAFVDDLRYADDDTDPVFLDIAQPDLALEGASTTADQMQGLDLEGLDAMVTEHEAWGHLSAGVSDDQGLRTVTRQLIRGGRGLVDAPVARTVVTSYSEATQLLDPERAATAASSELRTLLDVLEEPLSRRAKLDLEVDLRTRWVQAGRAPELFPSLEGWELHDRLPREIAALVFALVNGTEDVSDDRWREIADAISVDALGEAARGMDSASGGKLNDMVAAASDRWSARWAWVPAVDPLPPPSRVFDWALGRTSLEVNLFAHRAVFADKGNRFNMMVKPSELPYLEPRLATLDDPMVLGVTVITDEEVVGVQLRASSTETLGERLRRLMAEQAEIRISGRLRRMHVRIPGRTEAAEINFESGRMHADEPIPLPVFTALIARFMLSLPQDLQEQLEQRLGSPTLGDE